jgi:3-deoxy-D-manno-octulosonic-acid transferase
MILYYIYILLSFLLLPFLSIGIVLKEYKKIGYRILERFGIDLSKNSIKGEFSKKIIWIHAASIGEINIAILLIEEINRKYGSEYCEFLITTSNSSSSSEIIKSAQSKNPKLKNVIHRYIFIDNILFAKIFYSRLRPNLGIFIEAEIFPSIINYIGGKTNLILLNARISDSSYNKWLKIKSLFKYTIQNFKIIITQSKYDYQKYQKLGAKNLINIGNLKYARKIDTQSLIQIEKPENKLIVVCGSTYEGEEIGILLSIIELIKSKKVLLILVPRYIDRIEKIKNQIAKYDLNMQLRSSQNKIKISDENDVYLVDSFGELNSFYNIADISIIGNSFKDGGTGHNVIEPANFNSIVCFGSNMREFAEVSEEFVSTKSGIMLSSYSEINGICKSVIDNKNLIDEYSSNAKKLIKKYHGVLDIYMEQIDKFIK